MELGVDSPEPGLISLTIQVPTSVPSLRHNSRPFTPSSLEKNRSPLATVAKNGAELPPAVLMSRRSRGTPALSRHLASSTSILCALCAVLRPIMASKEIQPRVRVGKIPVRSGNLYYRLLIKTSVGQSRQRPNTPEALCFSRVARATLSH